MTIVGAGIAGLSAATRLAERGYPVTVFERSEVAGGNLASRGSYDVYPHMYLTWYRNLWSLLADAGVDRDEAFRAMRSVKQLERGDWPRFTALTDMYSDSILALLRNLFSGVAPVADLEIFGYGSFDLLAERWAPTMSLADVSVTGFMQARPYMTPRAISAFDAFITRVWAIPGYLASAADYQTYLDYCNADPLPSFFLPRGSAGRVVIGPLLERARRLGVDVRLGVAVERVECRSGRARTLTLSDGETVELDELILAVPPDALLRLVRSGTPGQRMVQAAPTLAEVSRLRCAPIPLLNLCFARRLPELPAEPVGLLDSSLNLAFTDISQTWRGEPLLRERTVLAVSASDPAGLPGTGPQDDGMAILHELARYVDFDPGESWGESPEIDWSHTIYAANDDAKLFVNEIGSDAWRCRVTAAGLRNVAFAGDHCQNRIGMTTIESAVTTGLEAARKVVERHGHGAPVEILEPRRRWGGRYLALRCLWAPYAAGAWWWSKLTA